jgi:hypothetical protein
MHSDGSVAKMDATAPLLKELSEKLDVSGYPSLFVAYRGAVFP